jgi:hypothetical protein
MMRFSRNSRPVDTRPLRERVGAEPSFALMRELMTRGRKLERRREASWLVSPVQAAARLIFGLEELEQDEIAIWRELCGRYEGVLKQMLAQEGLPVDEAGTRLDSVHWTARAEFAKQTEHELFPVVLWRACLLHGRSTPVQLKPKFMLRAFVDELPSSDERGVLRAICYGGSLRDDESTQERRKARELGCEMLHREVLSFGMRIDAMTDGALAHGVMSRLSGDALHAHYFDWLMA